MKPHLQGVPKPSTTSILAAAAAGPTPSRQPANIAAMAANARLQTELLQLSLLHRNSAASEAAWLESARVQLSTKWESLRDADAALRDQERAVVERRAVEALRAWGGGSGGTSLDARVQQLDSLVAAIWALASEPGSRFARATRKFERWVAGIGAVKEQRKRLLVTTRGLTLDRKPPTSVAVPGGKGRQAVAADDDDDDEDDGESPGGAAVAELPETEEDDADAEPVFVAPLDAAWHSERDALVARLDAWKRALAELDQHGTDDGDGLQTTTSSSSTSSLTVPPPLTQILVGLRALVNGMRAELDAMARIETDILAAEREWVRRAARAGEDGDGGGDAGKGGAGAIWRVL